MVSLGLALVLGTAGLPHILMRFFTVPNAKAARSSVVYAMFIIGFFYLLTTVIGFGARPARPGGRRGRRHRRQPAAPNLAEEPRWRRRHHGRRPVPGHHRRRGVRDDPRSPGSCCRRRARSRTTCGRASSARAGLRARGGAGGEDRGARDRRGRDPHRDPRRRGPERLLHGRARVRDRGQRQLPGAAARAELAALQHGRRRHRRAVRSSARSA